MFKARKLQNTTLKNRVNPKMQQPKECNKEKYDVLYNHLAIAITSPTASLVFDRLVI
jgi:hypothetical protein